MDEHRVGLKPILRKVWVPRGRRPRAVVKPRYKWLYVVGFVHPESGRTTFWIVSKLDAELFGRVLGEFAVEHCAGPQKRLLLVLDGAGWHTGEEVKAPEGVGLIVQPPHSPELQPAERLWPVCNEPLANRSPRSLDELEEILSERCCQMAQMQEFLRGLTFYHWWPSTAGTSTV